MRKTLALVVAVALAIVAGGSSALAGYSNTIRLAVGARQAGMGAAYRSIADDGTAPLYNPAGMGFQEGSTVNFDNGIILAHINYEDPQNEFRPGTEGSAGVGAFPDFGIVHKFANWPFAIGFGSYNYSAIRMKYDITSTILASGGEQANFNFDLMHSRMIPSLAWQVNDSLSLGGGYIRAFQYFAQATPYQFQGTVNPSALTGVNFYTDFDSTGWGQGGIFGALAKLGEKVRVGVSYTTKMVVKLKGRDEVTLRNNPGLIPFGISDGTRNNYAITLPWKWPQVLGTGISYQADEKWLLAFDWQWIDWSWAADKQEYILDNGNNATVNAVVGNGTIRDNFKQDARDAFIYHFGTEYKPKEHVALRAGYIFSNNPVRSATLTPLFNGNFQHTISLGFGTKLFGWELDNAWSHTFMNEQVVETSAIQGGEYNFSQTSNGNDIFFFSAKKRF